MSTGAMQEKSFLGEPIVHVSVADPRDSYPKPLRERLLAMERDPSAVPTEVGVPAVQQREGINHSNAIFRTATDAIIGVALRARGYERVTQHVTGEDTATVYALPPIESREEALAIGGVIKAGYELLKEHFPDEVSNMPTLAFPESAAE